MLEGRASSICRINEIAVVHFERLLMSSDEKKLREDSSLFRTFLQLLNTLHTRWYVASSALLNSQLYLSTMVSSIVTVHDL